MEAATFRNWLQQHGCPVDGRPHEGRRQGQAVVAVHRGGRTAELPLGGSRKALDFATEQAICEALDIDWSELPGAQRQP